MTSETSRFDEQMIHQAVTLALTNADKGGEPFGAVLTRGTEIVAEGVNDAHIDHDLTAHAEIQALRHAGKAQRQASHTGTTMYASGKPCAMCMAAMIQAGVARIVFAADDDLGGPYGFSTESLYRQMQGNFGHQGIDVVHLPHPESREAFERYQALLG
ncbi:nucleoside deaminase [Halomonas piscis]|uniref:Nucleoside deaminase n=1 Tax=Halomonas piscis TaxID=3031727 RepID=A0ABY9Z1H2_9GAMM|nr:nucleoside deaminase [Halomonas piscis]WNK20986.1 nucleoside deaminase [Halomonas piscis]